MIDLHTHSTASDGSLSPTELARAGKAAGLDVMALTDHDSAKGVPEFLAEAKRIGLIGISGIELSAEVAQGQMHLVGLNFDPEDAELNAKFGALLGGRDTRNHAMIAAFNENGIDLTYDEVFRFAGDDLVSRVHMAQALVARGVVSSIPEAFERYLAKGALCYRDRFRYSPAACIDMVKQAGGVVMLAHPLSLGGTPAELEARIAELRDLGLTGMECFYSTYDIETTVMLLRIAKRLNLVPSVGSDFHGTPKPTIFLGNLTVEESTESRLRTLLNC